MSPKQKICPALNKNKVKEPRALPFIQTFFITQKGCVLPKGTNWNFRLIVHQSFITHEIGQLPIISIAKHKVTSFYAYTEMHINPKRKEQKENRSVDLTAKE